jgi:hypothetical protein
MNEIHFFDENYKVIQKKNLDVWRKILRLLKLSLPNIIIRQIKCLVIDDSKTLRTTILEFKDKKENLQPEEYFTNHNTTLRQVMELHGIFPDVKNDSCSDFYEKAKYWDIQDLVHLYPNYFLYEYCIFRLFVKLREYCAEKKHSKKKINIIFHKLDSTICSTCDKGETCKCLIHACNRDDTLEDFGWNDICKCEREEKTQKYTFDEACKKIADSVEFDKYLNMIFNTAQTYRYCRDFMSIGSTMNEILIIFGFCKN